MVLGLDVSDWSYIDYESGSKDNVKETREVSLESLKTK